MILIDTNALVVLLVGLVDVRLISKHKRTSIYEEQDFHDLTGMVATLDNLVVLPNVWTEADNLLNDFRGNHKYQYLQEIANLVKLSTEKYIESKAVVDSPEFFDLGLTDSLLLSYGTECDLLITSDSALSDYARANGIKVYDMVKSRNQRL